MKAVKLNPVQKEHVVGYPFKVNIDDPSIELDDATPVHVILGLVRLDNTFVYSTDLPGATSSNPTLSFTWIEIRELIREITPTQAGRYTLHVIGRVNVAPGTVKRVTYQSVEVKVFPR